MYWALFNSYTLFSHEEEKVNVGEILLHMQKNIYKILNQIYKDKWKRIDQNTKFMELKRNVLTEKESKDYEMKEYQRENIKEYKFALTIHTYHWINTLKFCKYLININVIFLKKKE